MLISIGLNFIRRQKLKIQNCRKSLVICATFRFAMNVPKFFISRLVFRNSQKQKICFVFKRKVSHFRGISRNSRKSKWTRASSQNARYLCLWEGWETGINQKALKPFECTFGSLEGLERLACFCWHKLVEWWLEAVVWHDSLVKACWMQHLGQWVLGLVITDNSLVSDAGCASTVLWLSFGWLCTTWAFYFMPFLGHFGGVSRNFFTKIRVIDASFQLSSPKCNQRDKYIFYVGWNCNGPKVANFLDA